MRILCRPAIATLAILAAVVALPVGVFGQGQTPGRIDRLQLGSARAAANDQSLSAQCRQQFEGVDDPNIISYGRITTLLSGTNFFQSKEAMEDYFGRLQTGRNLQLTSGDDATALYSEVASDNLFLSAGLGYARFGLGALVSSGEEQSEGEDESGSAQQVFQAAGNAIAFLALPAFAWYNAVREGLGSDSAEVIRHFDSFLTLSVGADIPQMGAAIEQPAYNARLGFQGTYAHSAMNNVLGLFGQVDAAYAYGFADYVDNLGVRDGAHTDWGFGLAAVTVGIDLTDVVRIGATFAESSLPGVDLTSTLAVKLLPQ